MTNFDLYETITNKIIKLLEKGEIPWERCWTVSGAKITSEAQAKKVAFNRVSKTAYSLLNQMILEHTGEYATFKQWHQAGGKIKKGAKSEMVVFWNFYQKLETNANGEEKVVDIPVLRYYQVFHISDVEGVEPLQFKVDASVKEFDKIEHAENLITEYSERESVPIIYGGDKACYIPSKDEINIPDRFRFGTHNIEFYSTVFHEIAHSTGAEKRLDRESITGFSFFGGETYSKEELVAEITASGMLNYLGIDTEKSFRNNTAYIQSWLKALRNDKKMIVSASSKAEKALNYIINGGI